MASIQLGASSARMSLHPDAYNIPNASVNTCGRVAHEFGHPLGLDNTFSACNSIMMGSRTDGTRPWNHVVRADVDAVQRNYERREECVYAAQGGNIAEGCVDEDGDGVTVCDGDCDDNNPYVTYYCGGGCPDADGDGATAGSCGGTDCDDQNYLLNPHDSDGDSYSTCAGDCNDDNNASYPYASLDCPGYQADCMEYRDRNCNSVNDCDECFYTPVVVDVSGNGFNLTDGPGGVSFDLTGDGVVERLSWTSAGSDDAWLVLDRDGNGKIDNGRELFGGHTPQPPSTAPNGFLALAEYDRPENGGDSDGAVSGRDAVFAGLRLWQDANHNGLSEPYELHTLPSRGVASIELDYKESRRVDGHGNRFRYRAKVKDARGAQVGRWVWDVFLVAAR